MKLVKTLAIILLIGVIVYFLSLNDGENSNVYVDLIFKQYENASVSMVILGSLFIGILSGYLSAVFSVLTAKAEIRSLESKNRRISDELNDLRNVAIDEGIYDTEGGDY